MGASAGGKRPPGVLWLSQIREGPQEQGRSSGNAPHRRRGERGSMSLLSFRTCKASSRSGLQQSTVQTVIRWLPEQTSASAASRNGRHAN